MMNADVTRKAQDRAGALPLYAIVEGVCRKTRGPQCVRRFVLLGDMGLRLGGGLADALSR